MKIEYVLRVMKSELSKILYGNSFFLLPKMISILRKIGEGVKIERRQDLSTVVNMFNKFIHLKVQGELNG